METNLRQSEAKIFTEGIVAEKNLQEVVEEGVKKIKGTVTVKTSDVNFVKFNVNVAEKTKNGAENRVYPGIVTVMNEYKSIADVGEEAADLVKVSGDINPFRNQNSGEEVISYKTNFFKRLRADEEYNPHAEFSVELFISAMVPEMNAEGETGRLLVKGWMPTYNGIEPLALVVESDLVADIEAAFEPGQTVKFYGDVVNNRIVKTREIPVAIGKPRIETKTTYINDLVITGATTPYEEGISEEKPYDADVIKAAIQERENRIKEEQNKKNNKSAATTAKPSGAAHGRTIGW